MERITTHILKDILRITTYRSQGSVMVRKTSVRVISQDMVTVDMPDTQLDTQWVTEDPVGVVGVDQ